VTVVFDLLGFQNRDHGERGIARYVLHLALALERTAPGLVDQYLIHPDLPIPAGAEALLSTGRVVRIDRQVETRSPTTGGVFLAGSLFEHLGKPVDHVYPVWARSDRWRTLAVLYDLIPARFPQWYQTKAIERAAYRARTSTVAAFDRLLAISQASADDATELLWVDPGRLTVIGAGADERFHRPSVGPDEVTAGLVARGDVPGLRPGFILFPTGIDPRKNVDRMIEAYGRLPAETRRRHQLVLVCRMDDHAHRLVADLAHEAGVTEDLLATGFVSDEVLRRLYQGANLVVFPSLYEGFGLPVLEAMQCGAPVICSDSSSLKEVQTLPEARFDPTSVDAMATAMEQVLGDDELLRRLRHQPLPAFSWDESARLTAGVIEELRSELESRAVIEAPPRLRLALFSPLPPQETGIAYYTERLLTELRHYCDVTVFVDVEPSEVSAPDGVRVERSLSFDNIQKSGGAFDRILHFLGNSPFHMDTLSMLRRHGGWVLSHDVRLVQLYNSIERFAPEHSVTGSVGSLLATLYPHRYRPYLEESETIDPETANRFGIFLTREVAEKADRILVHSRFAATLLEMDSGVAAVPVYPLPCLADPDGSARRRSAAHHDQAPVIASFGIVDPVKAPEACIDALALVTEVVPTARLRLVGLVGEDYRDELLALAASHGLAGRVELTGQLDDAAFREAQLEATVAVQLRSATNGESSGAVSELLSLGVPTVVSQFGAMAELPDDATAKVSAGCGAAELATVLIGLLTDPGRRHALSDGALAYARANSYERAARTLFKRLFS
jgi:glycosyltransferase involved in cell wall biosynthesis